MEDRRSRVAGDVAADQRSSDNSRIPAGGPSAEALVAMQAILPSLLLRAGVHSGHEAVLDAGEVVDYRSDGGASVLVGLETMVFTAGRRH